MQTKGAQFGPRPENACLFVLRRLGMSELVRMLVMSEISTVECFVPIVSVVVLARMVRVTTTGGRSDGDADVYPTSVEIFYNESKAARDAVDQLLLRYRTNTTAVLALATGAATFFGFANSPKGPFFIASLVAYALATLVAVAIYWPSSWLFNVAYDVEERLESSPPLRPTKLRWDLARGHQLAIAENTKLIDGWQGQASKFRVLLLSTSLVVIFAGVNSYIGSQSPATIQPTHIIIEKEETT